MKEAIAYEDLCDLTRPAISVLTPSLNHGRFLRETIESVASQTCRNFEHIVIDGGSTDGSVEILKQYPHLRWVSERDRNAFEAYRKGLAMVRGAYVIQCCVSDGFLDRKWFQRCLEVLEKDDEVSLVWGFAQMMSEDGGLLNVSFQEFFSDPPPQKRGFLAYWLATGFALPEGNYCVRRNVIEQWFPAEGSDECFILDFMYSFVTQGYSPYFIPVVANFGRQHHDQRTTRLGAVLAPGITDYFRRTKRYAKRVLNGEITHLFRNGRGEVIGKLEPQDLAPLRRQIWRHRLLSSPLMRRDLYSIAKGLGRRVRRRLLG